MINLRRAVFGHDEVHLVWRRPDALLVEAERDRDEFRDRLNWVTQERDGLEQRVRELEAAAAKAQA